MFRCGYDLLFAIFFNQHSINIWIFQFSLVSFAVLIDAMSITRIEAQAAHMTAYGYMIAYLCE
ncbi:MAG: DUF3986 family protein [Clostridia bacterium]|nr:DUF3986 family protein [Clostridia bacterium]